MHKLVCLSADGKTEIWMPWRQGGACNGTHKQRRVGIEGRRAGHGWSGEEWGGRGPEGSIVGSPTVGQGLLRSSSLLQGEKTRGKGLGQEAYLSGRKQVRVEEGGSEGGSEPGGKVTASGAGRRGMIRGSQRHLTTERTSVAFTLPGRHVFLGLGLRARLGGI